MPRWPSQSNTPIPRVTVASGRPSSRGAGRDAIGHADPAPAATPTPQGGGVDIAVAFQNPSCLAGPRCRWSSVTPVRRRGRRAGDISAQVRISLGNAAGLVGHGMTAADRGAAPGAIAELADAPACSARRA